MSAEQIDCNCTMPEGLGHEYGCQYYRREAKPASLPPVEQGAQPASDLSALREAFRAGFLAVHRAEGPYHMTRVWTFDGVAAADLEPEAWEAYKAQLAGLSRPEGK
jgi:hypothetical protein